VGPDANDLITFHTALLTPKRLALPGDSRAYSAFRDYKAGNASPCLKALLGYAQCAQVPGSPAAAWQQPRCLATR
jgi:hypothetical protein